VSATLKRNKKKQQRNAGESVCLPGVRGWELVLAVGLVDLELLGSGDAAQALEAVERHAGGARHELQQLGSLLLPERVHRLPEPLDDRTVLRIP
jgi:hypothetical protein